MKRHEVLAAFSFVAGAFRKAVAERYQSSRSICVRLSPAALTACNEAGREGLYIYSQILSDSFNSLDLKENCCLIEFSSATAAY